MIISRQLHVDHRSAVALKLSCGCFKDEPLPEGSSDRDGRMVKMRQDMVIRHSSPGTVECYLWHVKAFQTQIHTSPDQVTENDIGSEL